MTPLNNNDPYISATGKRSTLGAEIGGGQYTLPTASSQTKGGIKIGSGLTMAGETLNADAQLPAHTSTEAGKVLTVGNDGELLWDENGGSGVVVISETDWKALTLEEKQALGLVVIETSSSGFVRGEYVDASLYDAIMIVQKLNVGTLTSTWNDGVLTLVCENVVANNGLVLSVEIPCTSVIVEISENTPSVQFGRSSKGATLPNIVYQGTGRIDYDTANANTGKTHTFTSFNYETQNIFMAPGATGSFTATIELVTT